MEDGEDWLFRPILARVCDYSMLDDPARDLGDFVQLNEALDIEAENQVRVRLAYANRGAK